MPRIEPAPPLPSNPVKDHKGETSSNSTLSIGTMSDDATPAGPGGAAGGPEEAAGHGGGGTPTSTAVDDESPRSTAVDMGSKKTPTATNVTSGASSALGRAAHHRRSFSDEEQHRHLMAMQQQEKMMMMSHQQKQANTVTVGGVNTIGNEKILDRIQRQQQMANNNNNGQEQLLSPPKQHSRRRRSDDREERRSQHRGHRSHRSHGGGGSGNHGHSHRSSRKSRKGRARSQSADADFYEQQYYAQQQQQQQQQQQLAYQQQMQYGSPSAAAYGNGPLPPYRPNPHMQDMYSQQQPGMPPRTPGKSPPNGGADFVTPPSKSSSGRRRGDRRSGLQKSVSAPLHGDLFASPGAGGYGSMDPHIMQQQSQQGGPITPMTNGFSPRQELLALAGQQRSTRTSPGAAANPSSPGAWTQGMPPPQGAAGGGLSPGGVPMNVGANRGRTSSWNAGDARRGIPPVARLSPLRETRPISQEDIQVGVSMGPPPLSPDHGPMPHPSQQSGLGVYEAPDSGETEAFLPQHIGGHHSGGARGKHHSHNRSMSSSRKMHMRQQSVELFMDNVKGVGQPRRCRDVFFALLFYLQLGAMIFVGIRYGGEALRPGAVGVKSDRTEEIYTTYHNFIIVACMSGAFAVATSALALLIMMAISRRLVQVALIFSIGMAFAWGTIGIGLSPKSFVPITGIIALALSIGYTFVVYERIPFATSNLRTALSGIRSNLGLVGVAFCFQALTLAVSIYYAFAGVGLCDAILFGDLHLSGWCRVLAYIGVGLAYYWTYQVLCHVVQVTVAGVIGSWWFKTDAESSPCSDDLTTSFLRSTLLSFGSICFGSLLVGFVQILRQFAEPMRPNRDESVLMCLQECIVCFQECIVSCIDGLADSFNPWAFSYVGLYGYGFLDAGHNATELFRKRGWSTIVTDDLIPNVLFMVSLVIGGVTGCFAVLVEVLEDYRFYSIYQSTLAAFLTGLTIGLILSSVLFGLISSAVNAVIVCFAGSPVEFQRNHSELSDEMRTAWREVWPGCMDITDMKIQMESGGTRLVF